MHNALILHYQSLEPVNLSEPNENRQPLGVSPADFADQLALIKKLRIPVVSLGELVDNRYKRRRWHRHVVVLCCSDTFVTNNDTVLPLLEHYGFPATVFITTAPQTHAECWAQWRQIAATGLSLGSRAVSGVDLTRLPEPEMRREIIDSKSAIEAETGQPVRFLLPPLGSFNKSVKAMAKEAGYEAMLTNRVGYNMFNADLFQLKSWFIPAPTSLNEFEKMLHRDRKELLAQKVKARTKRAGKLLFKKGPLERLKRLLAKMRVKV